MDVLVTQQEDVINAIEISATQVQKDTEAGYVTRCFAEFHLNGVAASDKLKKQLNMPDRLAESVGSAFSYFLLSWLLLVLRLELLSERSRWPLDLWLCITICPTLRFTLVSTCH